MGAFIIAGVTSGQTEPAKDADPFGIIRKPIPEKMVVLTFDDGCRSHATFVGPLLKKYGFGATFYITRFGNPALDPGMYMSWAEIKGLETMGFEIGNHTWYHNQFGGDKEESKLPGSILQLEDAFRSNNIAKPTTFCWPIYTVSKGLFHALAENGYLFARSGGRNDRPYTPTVESPFQTPSFTIMANTPLETFTSAARRAVRGRIPIYTFHGVPDIEHPGVGVAPALFEQMMKYLKDNQYTVIAMRDIATYVDAKKAAQYLPIPDMTPDVAFDDTEQLLAGKRFESPTVVCQVTARAGDVGKPASMTFGGTGSGWVMVEGLINGNVSLIHSAPYVLDLRPRTGTNALNRVCVIKSVLQASPQGLNGAPLTLQNATLKLQDPWNTWKDFSSPMTLAGTVTVQALNSNRAVMTGRMSGSGDVTYIGFYPIGRVSSDSDYAGNTRIAQDEWFGQNPDDRQGHDDLMFGISGTRPFGTGVLTIAGKVGTRMGRAWFGGTDNVIPNAVILETSLVFNPASAFDMTGPLSGPGSLVKVFNAKDNGNILKLRGDNTYSGGTRFFSGKLEIHHAHALGIGPVILGGRSKEPNHAMSLCNQGALTLANAFELAGITESTVEGTCPTFAGNREGVVNDPAAVTEFNTAGGDLTLSGPICGSGGLLKTGTNTLILAGTNRYAGSTVVGKGRLSIASQQGLSDKTDLFVSEGAMLDLSYKGKMRIHQLTLGGALQPAGVYDAVSSPGYITGTGAVRTEGR